MTDSFSMYDIEGNGREVLYQFLKNSSRDASGTFQELILKVASALVVNGMLDHEDSLLINDLSFRDTLFADDEVLVERAYSELGLSRRDIEDITRMGLVYLLSGAITNRTQKWMKGSRKLKDAAVQRKVRGEGIKGKNIVSISRDYDENTNRTGLMVAIEEAYYTEMVHMIYPFVQDVIEVRNNTITVFLPEDTQTVKEYIRAFPDNKEEELRAIQFRVDKLDTLLKSRGGVSHNDLTPDNVLVDTDGNLWLRDFSKASRLTAARAEVITESWLLRNILY